MFAYKVYVVHVEVTHVSFLMCFKTDFDLIKTQRRVSLTLMNPCSVSGMATQLEF